MKLFQDKTKYVLDTNVFRYKTATSTQESVDKRKMSAIRFWKMVLNEALAGQTSLYVPAEVKRELEVQSFT
ncbi:PIN domain-containing protein [Alteribacillus iranensis]|uniref:PIN domain-containing protein n=1 Tax=Alteribacillus iranensis TaxID=930128 RepID=A0A1I2BWE3_9BACI|nr:DUF4411 family protein [Alteribacillus iranensis]SFE59743.1 protein of unknown function [Alteribacillus iranensis]